MSDWSDISPGPRAERARLPKAYMYMRMRTRNREAAEGSDR